MLAGINPFIAPQGQQKSMPVLYSKAVREMKRLSSGAFKEVYRRAGLEFLATSKEQRDRFCALAEDIPHLVQIVNEELDQQKSQK
jgi:hypothetical protein